MKNILFSLLASILAAAGAVTNVTYTTNIVGGVTNIYATTNIVWTTNAPLLSVMADTNGWVRKPSVPLKINSMKTWTSDDRGEFISFCNAGGVAQYGSLIMLEDKLGFTNGYGDGFMEFDYSEFQIGKLVGGNPVKNATISWDGNISAVSYAGDGGGLTNLNANSITNAPWQHTSAPLDCIIAKASTITNAVSTVYATNIVMTVIPLTYSGLTNVFLDCQAGQIFTLSLTNNAFIIPTNVTGKFVYYTVNTLQDSTGNRTVTWQTNRSVSYVKFSGGIPYAATTNAAAQDVWTLATSYHLTNLNAVLTPNVQ